MIEPEALRKRLAAERRRGRRGDPNPMQAPVPDLMTAVRGLIAEGRDSGNLERRTGGKQK